MKGFKLPFFGAVITGVLFFWIGARSGLAVPNLFQFDGDLVLESEVVCSPERNPSCGPGPYTETVQVPPGVEAVNIDVYWHLWGQPQQQQTNEHSNFTASVDGETLGRVYCPDFGDFDDSAELCGSVTGDVSPGQELTLEIVHADETTGDSSGSHYQVWVIDWLEEAAPSATPEATSTAAAPSPTASSTPTGPVSGPAPSATATTTAPPTEATPEVTATEQGASPTPTPTEPVSGPFPPGTATFTPAPTVVTPAATSTELVPTPSPTSTEPVSGPAPPGTATPTPSQAAVTPAVTPTDTSPAPSPSPTTTEPVSGPGQQGTATSTPVQQETEEAQQALTRTPAPTAAPTVGTGTPAVLPVTGAHLPGASGSGLLWKFGLALAGLGLVAYGLLREWRKE